MKTNYSLIYNLMEKTIIHYVRNRINNIDNVFCFFVLHFITRRRRRRRIKEEGKKKNDKYS